MELHELMSRAEKHRVEATREGANENGEMQITGAKKKGKWSNSQWIDGSITRLQSGRVLVATVYAAFRP